jgi:hypothetical protein
MGQEVLSKRYSFLRRRVWPCVRERGGTLESYSRECEILRLKEKIEEGVRSLEQPQLYQNGRRVDRLEKLHFALSCSPFHLILSFRPASKAVRRRVIDVARDAFGALALKTEWLGRSELIEIRSGLEKASSGEWRTARQEFQTAVEALISGNFPKITTLHSVVHSDLEHSVSGRYVRLHFRSGGANWYALAVGPWEDQATIDATLSSGLIWRELLRAENARPAERLALIVPSGKLLVLKSRMAWTCGAGQRIHLLEMDLQKGALSFVDLRDCGNLDTALSQVQSWNSAKRQTGCYRTDLNSERWLESLILRDVRMIDSRLDPRFVYPQVPAFLSGDRGMIDLLSVTSQGRLAVLELKVGEDIELPMQGLDYWLRVRWHHLRQEFQNQGYFPGVRVSTELPLLYFVCPQFRYHSSFPQIVRQIDPAVPMIQVGINENWKSSVQVVLKRRLNSATAEFPI